MPNRTATIQTNKGTIKFELLEEDAPKTTENFRLLAEQGFYDGVIFHRVIKGFVFEIDRSIEKILQDALSLLKTFEKLS